MPPGEQSRLASKAKRELLLALLADGMKIKPALAAVGVVATTWYGWRDKFPEFRHQADAAIRSHGKPKEGFAPTLAHAFIDFRQLYFGNDTPAHHAKMIDAITKAKPETINLMLAPPGHGKSTLMVDWITFRIARDPNYRCCVISETGAHAEKVLRQIARRMTDEVSFAPFIARYGPFKPEGREVMKPWNAQALAHVKATHDEKEPSIEAKGIGDQIYGARYDEIWLDDVQSTKTKNLTDKFMEYFQQDVLTRPMENGRIHFIGTRVAAGDVYERLMTEDDEGRTLAATVLSLPALDHRGESLWPEVWPKERLAQRRANIASNEVWARVYMQQPSSSEDATFTEDMIRNACDAKRTIGQHSHDGVTVFAVDPALVGWTVVLTCHLTQDRIEIVDMMRRRNCNSNETILRMVEEQARLYRPRTGIFELAGFQGALFNDQRLSEIARQYGFWIKPHTTAGRKADPSLGVASMDSTFLRGEISIPWGDQKSRDRFAPLVEEFRRWRSDVPTRQLRQDTVMCAWFTHRHWMLDVRKTLQVREPIQLWRPTWEAGSRWKAG